MVNLKIIKMNEYIQEEINKLNIEKDTISANDLKYSTSKLIKFIKINGIIEYLENINKNELY